MRDSPMFAASRDQVDALVAEYPLAQVVSREDLSLVATPLPLLMERGKQTLLIGHFARNNPQVQTLREHPRALFIFMGPQADPHAAGPCRPGAGAVKGAGGVAGFGG